MALINCSFLSKSLKSQAKINVILPSVDYEELMSNQDQRKERKLNYQTLYLLHGYSGDESDWQRYTRIEKYAEENKVAVVMPSAGNSFYTDMNHGGAYFTYIAEELPNFVEAMFPLSKRKEDRFIAGLSMGGYGAFKIALSCPTRYHTAASLSGVLDINDAVKRNESRDMKLEDVFGNLDELEGSKHDLIHLAKKLIERNIKIPKLYQACGTEDFLYRNNLQFKQQAKEIGLDVDYVEGPGIHDWNFWDYYIKQVLEWMPLSRNIGTVVK